MPVLQVTLSDFRDHLSAYLDKAEAGEEILITRSGRVIVRLTAARDTRENAKARLAALRKKAWVGDAVSAVGANWEASR
jgi:prevent-host-death family protein